MNWNHFAIFIEVYRLQSISRAADVLNMSQPGVSNALKRLQTSLGVELFVRKGRGIVPTVAANLLAEQLEAATKMIDVALEQVTDFDPNKPHRFEIATNEVIQHLLLPYIDHPMVGNCKINLSLSPYSDDDLEACLMENQADLAVDFQDNLIASFCSTTLLDDELVVVASNRHPSLKAGQPLTLEAYYQQTHIVQRLRRGNQMVADYFSKNRLKQRDIVAQADSMLSAMMLVAKTQHITLVSRHLASAYAKEMGLAIFDVPFEAMQVSHKLMWHKRVDHSAGHRWLRDTLQALIDIAVKEQSENG